MFADVSSVNVWREEAIPVLKKPMPARSHPASQRRSEDGGEARKER